MNDYTRKKCKQSDNTMRLFKLLDLLKKLGLKFEYNDIARKVIKYQMDAMSKLIDEVAEILK